MTLDEPTRDEIAENLERTARLQAEIRTALAAAARVETVTGLQAAPVWYVRVDCNRAAEKFEQAAANLRKIGTRPEEHHG